MKHKRAYALLVAFLCAILIKAPVWATNIEDTDHVITDDNSEEQKCEVHLECGTDQTVTIGINLLTEEEIDGFDIYRADTADGNYIYIGNLNVADDDYYDYEYDDYYDYYDDYDDYESDYDYIYEDETVLEAYKTYYYRVEAYQYNEDEDKVVISTVEADVVIQSKAPVITYGKRNGKLGTKIKWKKDKNADGYLIYRTQNYTKRSRYQYVDTYDKSQYELVKTIKKNSKVSVNFKKLMNGVTYTYRICSYKMIDGKKVESAWSEPKSVLMNYYSYDGESELQKIKRAFGSEKKRSKNFKNSSVASKQMKTIKIKVWDFRNGKKGKKVTRTKYLTVNKRLAPSIKAMFDEIYKAKQKQVIKDIGCYSYRTGEHMYGMAIDINWNENYMIDDGKVLAGSFWNPKKSKYSIPLDCEMVRIMKRYGFYRGFWGDRKDYMHFSYFGT